MIIFRWWYFTGIAGLALCVFGSIETNLALQSGTAPIVVTIDDLEGGQQLAQPFVRLGEHVALEQLGVTHRRRRGQAKVLYPLVGVNHPIVRALQSPPSSKAGLPGFEDLHVFALRDGDSLARGAPRLASVEGTVFAFDALSSTEQNLVTLAVPNVDRERVRVLEVGRRPRPLIVAIGCLIAGVLLLLAAIRLFRGPRKPKAPPADRPFLHDGLK